MLKIILADSQTIFRAGAAKILAVEDDFRIVAQCESAEKTLSAAESFRNAVLVVSAGLVDLQQVLRIASAATSRVVAIGESTDAPEKFFALGACGFVRRNVSGKSLVECVRRVSRGELWNQDAQPSHEISDLDTIGARVRQRLNPRELRIVALIVQGFKNKEISEQLGTTEQVVKNQLRKIYDKIGVSDRLELALFTIHHHILHEAATSSAVNAADPSKSAAMMAAAAE